MKKIKVGIIGGGGYTAGELIRILLHHDAVSIQWVQSDSQNGKKIYDIHKDLVGETSLTFSQEISPCDVVFLCKGHGESQSLIAKYPTLLDSKIIDLSQDFRISGNHDFVYGLPEVFRSQIKNAKHIANPGCFATALQLSLLPAVREKIAFNSFHISGITGATGAGQTPTPTGHFSWRYGNISTYKTLTHQHLKETLQTLKILDKEFDSEVNFIPFRGTFTRGIITTTYFDTNLNEEMLIETYQNYFANEPFTHVVNNDLDIKMVTNTNKALIQVKKIENKAVIVCVLDNLLKGASGQAVQNMNILFNLDEKRGLQLKPSAF